jgi:protein-disulfide isomerase-like protein with CxxC motif
MVNITVEQRNQVQRQYASYLSTLQPAYYEGAIRAIVAAECLCNAVNEIGFDHAAFAMAIGCQHRTLQQGVVRAFVQFANRLASDYDEGKYDLRNEAACKLAVKISKLNFGLPFI